MHLLDRSLKDLVAMTAKTPPELGGSTAALLSSLLGIAICKMALLTSAKKRPDSGLTLGRLDAIAMDLSSTLDLDQASVKQLLEVLKKNVDPHEKHSVFIEATRQPLAACHLLVDAMEVLVSARGEVDQSVTSDYYGGAAVIAASLREMTLAVDANLRNDFLAEMRQRTASERATLQTRFNRAAQALDTL